MPEKPIEGNQQEGEQEAKPVSSVPGGQPSAEDLAREIAELRRQNAAHEATLRALQSGKDSAVARVERETKSTLERYAEVLGIDPAQLQKASRQIALDDLADAYLDESQPETASDGAGAREGSKLELQTIETALDLPTDDPRVTDLKLKHGSDPEAFMREGVKLKAELAKAQSKLTPAENIMPGGRPKVEQPRTDADIRREVFGESSGFFKEETIRQAGGGAFVSGKKVEK